MKYLIILGDGMADEPIDSLNGQTLLQVANTPNMDNLATLGCCGLLKTVPDNYQPGSEIANLSVLGYDVDQVFEGRGSLEAASIGVPILDNEMAMRCNLICIQNGMIKNHSAGHISNEEASELIDFLQKELGDDQFSFHTGVSYRHLLKMKNGNKALHCTAPHDVPGTAFNKVLVKSLNPDAQLTADYLNDLILSSHALLENHPINVKRKQEGKDPANSIWPWSPGYRPHMQTLMEIYGIKRGSVISAVDLIKGIGVYAGLKPIEVVGATGLYNTNYEGKAQAALDALKRDDFVYLHIEASDEAGHEGDVELKLKTIESLDSRIVGPIFEALKNWSQPVAIAILPDHPTPCKLRTHTRKPVPFIIYKPGSVPDDVRTYDEFSVLKGSYGLMEKDEFIKEFIK